MKKIMSIFLTAMMIFCLAACGNAANQEEESSAASTGTEETTQQSDTEDANITEAVTETEEADETSGEDRILIAYFSRTGNTETIANMIAEETGGELFQVETVTPYPDDYNETVDIAREEQNSDARPELSTHVENMQDYNVIFLGYPNWWGTMPMVMFTFLEEYDFSGKTIIPFCTHGGSALGSSERDIAELVPEAQLLDGLAVSGSAVDGAQEDVTAWIEGLGILE